MSTPIKRKLAAILAADVAGYSRLMGADEEGTLRLLAAHRAVVREDFTRKVITPPPVGQVYEVS